MPILTDKQYVEIFHLIFLSHLGRKVDKRYYTLKGGCNLRFFFKSPRYSEDMDLDAREIPGHKLADKVHEILTSKPFAQILQARGMSINHVNSDKQTLTTQRWKLGLSLPGTQVSAPTKIEFSRRGMDNEREFADVDTLVTAGYNLSPILVTHYTIPAAFEQKIRALVDRKETQARDVFDLYWLLAMGANHRLISSAIKTKLIDAMDRVMSIDFDLFAAHVLSFLSADDRALYDAAMWDTMRLRVYEAMKEGGS